MRRPSPRSSSRPPPSLPVCGTEHPPVAITTARASIGVLHQQHRPATVDARREAGDAVDAERDAAAAGQRDEAVARVTGAGRHQEDAPPFRFEGERDADLFFESGTTRRAARMGQVRAEFLGPG